MDTPNDVPEGQSVTFRIGMKIPETFGKFSSTEIAIELTGPADITKFEEHVNHYVDRVLKYEREIINSIAVASGQKPYFGDSNGQKA